MNEDYAALLNELEFLCREYMGDDNALEAAACIRTIEIIEAIRNDRHAPAQVAEVICVGRARFPRTGGNAGLSWYAEDTLGDTAGHRTGQPKDGELLFVLAAAQKGEKE